MPIAFSGGVGWGSRPGPSEAEIAARIAEHEFARPLRWLETQSRDTNENAVRTLAMLNGEGIQRIVLVTHGLHMRRALEDFERAKQNSNSRIAVQPAPMGMEAPMPLGAVDWMPTSERLHADAATRCTSGSAGWPAPDAAGPRPAA